MKKHKEFDKLTIEYEKALGDVIIKLNRIEALMENVLLEKLKPNHQNYRFIKTVLFNSSYLSFANKLGLIKEFLKEKGWKENEFEPYHKLLNIRNAFAHSNKLFVTSHELDKGLNVINRKIEINQKKRETIVRQEFRKLHNEFNSEYDKIFEKLKETAVASEKVWTPNVLSKIKKLPEKKKDSS